MVPPPGSFVDPLSKKVFLGLGEGILFFERGHVVIVVVCQGNPLDEEGVGSVARDEGFARFTTLEGEFPLIEPKSGFYRSFIGSMTGVAVVREDGLNLGGEINLTEGGKAECKKKNGSSHVRQLYGWGEDYSMFF